MAGVVTMINKLLDWIRSLFWKEEMELTLVGLQGSGKQPLLMLLRFVVNFFLVIFC
uniref:Uncharacterized protein n=1 Tax=Meloidogyne incognita TaxID=6306 RepID=A0A914LXY1_MELIC